jgi:hypothetical protein
LVTIPSSERKTLQDNPKDVENPQNVGSEIIFRIILSLTAGHNKNHSSTWKYYIM